MRAAVWLMAVGLAVPLGALAQTSGAERSAWTARAVTSGTSLRLDDGREVRLVGVRLPEAAAGGELRAAQAAAAAEAALARLALDRPLRPLAAPVPVDRHGRLLGQIERTDGLWLQAALLEQGLVLLAPEPGAPDRHALMRASEQVARAGGRGLWAVPGWQPVATAELGGATGRFRIVHGRIERVASVGRFVYLNFGADWRTDFTLRLAPDLLAADWPDLDRLVGREVEARGVVQQSGGPLIELAHPAQIEVLP